MSRCHLSAAFQFSKKRRAQASRPVVPQLPEGFLEQIGDVEPAVGLEQLVKGAAAVEGEIVAVRQQRVLLALDDAAVLAAQAGRTRSS